MRIARQSPQELVVVDGTRWLTAVIAAVTLFIVYMSLTRHQPKGFILAVVFLAFGLAFYLRKTFTFDAMQRIVRWQSRTILKAQSGEIPFDAISDIGTELGFADHDVPTYRLTLVTAQSTIPMAFSYHANSDGYSPLRAQILEFIRPGAQPPATTAAQSTASILRDLIGHHRKIEAIAYLRAKENLSLVDAKTRVDALESEIKAGR